MAELFIGDRMTTSTSSKIDISSATVTLVSNSFVYDGSVKTQAVQSVVLNGQTLVDGTDYIVTNYFKTNAGTYTLAVRGIGDYEGVATANWSIAKAQGSISVSKNNMNFIVSNASDTSTITYTGDGEITLSNSNTTAVTAMRSGNTITVTANAEGNATITVTLAAGQNYTGGSVTISATVSLISATLSDNTPEQIKAAAQAGIASTLWSVGAVTTLISIGTVGIVGATSARAFIIGFDHNSSVEGTGIHFQFGKTTSGVDIAWVDSAYSNTGSRAAFRMNTSNINVGGWESSYMRSTICAAFLTALPSAWQNVIVTTTKYTDNTGNKSTAASAVTTTSDKIFLLNEQEVFGARSYANTNEASKTAQYAYYANGNSKIKYKHSDTSAACSWWLRSPDSSTAVGFCCVGSSGGAGGNNAYRSYGFAPGFSIA